MSAKEVHSVVGEGGSAWCNLFNVNVFFSGLGVDAAEESSAFLSLCPCKAFTRRTPGSMQEDDALMQMLYHATGSMVSGVCTCVCGDVCVRLSACVSLYVVNVCIFPYLHIAACVPTYLFDNDKLLSANSQP